MNRRRLSKPPPSLPDTPRSSVKPFLQGLVFGAMIYTSLNSLAHSMHHSHVPVPIHHDWNLVGLEDYQKESLHQRRRTRQAPPKAPKQPQVATTNKHHELRLAKSPHQRKAGHSPHDGDDDNDDDDDDGIRGHDHERQQLAAITVDDDQILDDSIDDDEENDDDEEDDDKLLHEGVARVRDDDHVNAENDDRLRANLRDTDVRDKRRLHH